VPRISALISIFADIDEPPRPQLEFSETFAIGAQGHFVVDARGHVAEMCPRNILPHDRLEVENVKRLRRLGNQLVKNRAAPSRPGPLAATLPPTRRAPTVDSPPGIAASGGG
jgi:hypothetical protein